ncbi:MAG: hypothetical protein E7058_05765 [Lentisphaerae bacterium]|nr:hypothetical protein [Lentisphaerota bacterium]
MKTVIVCDSGLGGLNIAAGFFQRELQIFEPCRLVFFNAYPAKDMGFNQLPDERSQEELFRRVLEGMKRFSPDVCLIACNTLSIIYERLAQWYTPQFPVIGIVDAAVKKMCEALQHTPGSQLLILGTKSTVGSGAYARKLQAAGIAADRIKALACPGLATLLESDPSAVEVAEKITAYAVEAEKLLDKNASKIFPALCCTHFEFAEKLWFQQFDRRFPGKVEIINPNRAFPAEISPAECQYSARIGFFPGAKAAMTEYFAGIPALVQALENAEIDPDLFNIKGIWDIAV